VIDEPSRLRFLLFLYKLLPIMVKFIKAGKVCIERRQMINGWMNLEADERKKLDG